MNSEWHSGDLQSSGAVSMWQKVNYMAHCRLFNSNVDGRMEQV